MPECPADAIYADQDVPADQQHFVDINADLAKIWPEITRKKDPLPDAEEWTGVANKLEHLDRAS